jgi:hypothetical protein
MPYSDKTALSTWPHDPGTGNAIPSGTTSPKAGWKGNLQEVKEWLDWIRGAFNGTTGHTHTGSDGDGTQIPTGGIADTAVTTAKITDANVTTAKIADANVTTAKIADANVTTAKIAASAVTSAKVDTTVVTSTVLANVNFADFVLQRPEIKDYAESVSTNATSSTAATINLENGNVHDLTLTANCTLTFSNPPATGKAGSFTLILRQDATGSRTVTWPASVKWSGGTAPTLTTTASGIDILTFTSVDGGTVWFGFSAGGGMA